VARKWTRKIFIAHCSEKMEELNLWLHYRRLADDTKADARLREFMKLQNQYIDEIINGRYCRRCKNICPNQPTPHGKVVVNESKPPSQCRYAKIQRWLDFLVNHRDLIVDWSEYCDQIKHVFQVLSRRKNGPPMDWHYRQLFHEDMPAEPQKPTEMPIPEEVSVHQKPTEPIPIVKTTSGSDRHRREFLRFFIDFYLTEYGNPSWFQTCMWIAWAWSAWARRS
jgi:hypothetical protein